MAANEVPVRPRCEGQVDPIGIGVARPRLTWWARSDQIAYQIVSRDLWDSGRVDSSAPAAIFDGAPPRSRRRVSWKVRTWDADGNVSPYSDEAHFEYGLLAPSEWLASSIRSSLVGDAHHGVPSPYFTHEFDVDGDIASARLYITALGLYDAEINGLPVTTDVYRPGWTDYRYRVPYQTFDVTSLIVPGANAIGVVLGDGWYCGHIGFVRRQAYGDRPVLIAQLMIDVAGRDEPIVVSTGPSWMWSTGPIVSGDNFMGETYDARLEMPGWSKPGFDRTAWQPVEEAPTMIPTLVAAVAPPIRRTQMIPPVSLTEPSPGTFVFDLGQNMVGWARLRVSGEAGTKVVLRHAEMLAPDGNVYTVNLRTAKATDTYILSGDDEETYEPRFTFHGFRYVEVTGYPGTPTLEDIIGVVIHSDTPVTGAFECSNDLVNQLQSNITWSQRGNFLDVPTDCPQRAERMGWTGDAQIFAPTAAFNMDVSNFFSKWLTDVVDAQSTGGVFDGEYPAVVPRVARKPWVLAGNPGVSGGGPAWEDAGVIVPWEMYMAYGDVRVLERQYPSLERWMDFLARRDADLTPGVWQGFGDWVSLDFDPNDQLGLDDRWGGTPLGLIAHAFHAHAADLMEKIATALGRTADARDWKTLFNALRESFVVDWTRDHHLMKRAQTAAALALRFNLVQGRTREAIFDDLVQDIEARGHLVTGFVGTPHLLHVLTEGGRLDLAYRLLERTEYPGWLYPVALGATTIWERWDAWSPEGGFHTSGMNSFNHYAYGAVGEWLYRVVGGIAPAAPGYERIDINPRPGGSVTWARTTFDSVRGRIACEWRLEAGQMQIEVEIPPTTTATVRGTDVGSGKHTFNVTG